MPRSKGGGVLWFVFLDQKNNVHYKRSFFYVEVFVLKLDLQGLWERFAR